MRIATLVMLLMVMGMAPTMGHDQNCTLTTEQIELEAGQTTSLLADFTHCGSSLADFFGYRTRTTRSRQLRKRDHITLMVTDLVTGQEYVNAEGWVRVFQQDGVYLLEASNTSRRQTVTVRLRAAAR